MIKVDPQPPETHKRTYLVLLMTFSSILGPTDFACLCVLTTSPIGAGVLGGAESGWGVCASISGSLSSSTLLPDLDPAPKAADDATAVSIVKLGMGSETEAEMTVGFVYERAEVGCAVELGVGGNV